MSRDCDDGCGELAQERLRYFTGRHMTARDFRDEQAYHRTHRLLHNRMLHGWGVVCGLDVRPHPNPECRPRFVKVDCGFALDCCGREIYVPKEAVPPEIPWDQLPRPDDGPNGDEWYLLLCLQYEETATELLPVLYHEQNCDPQRRENSRVREGYAFAWHWIRKSELPDYQWKMRSGSCPDPKDGEPCIEDDCDDGSSSGPCKCCLEPQCPRDHCVPLALICISEKGPIERDNIWLAGRPALETPQYELTHVCSINWRHGGEMTPGELADMGALRIRFDRRLKPQPDDQPTGPTGINACTFVVQFGGGAEDLDFVAESAPPSLEYDCVAVYPLDPRRRKGYRVADYSYLEHQTVFISLHCDFILDCHDRAVDGNHIGGLLPSGDGVAGGTFLSWFKVVPDGAYDRRQEVQS